MNLKHKDHFRINFKSFKLTESISMIIDCQSYVFIVIKYTSNQSSKQNYIVKIIRKTKNIKKIAKILILASFELILLS